MKDISKIEYHRKTCLMCGSELKSEPLMILESMPRSAQDIPDEDEVSADSGIELRLFKCEDCGLYQFDCDPVSYYRDVIRAVGLSETMRNLRRSDYAYMIEKYGLLGKRFLECGCGRGEFLEVLSEFPVEVYGTENNAEFAESAKKTIGEDRIISSFPETENDIFFGGDFDCFLSFNFLEHQPHPTVMLKSMYNNLKNGGYGLITVPSFEYILKEGRYYELIRDHIANYSLDTLIRLCRDCGFEILESGYIGIGDTLRVVVRKAKTVGATKASGAEETEELKRLTENYVLIKSAVKEFTDELENEGKRLCLWGAGHQGFTIASTTTLSRKAAYILDSAPFKQGRFAPASHIPIVAPEHFKDDPCDAILIVAPGYAKEINETIKRSFGNLKDKNGADINPPEVFKLSSDRIEKM